jgi:hypothetical protein
MRIHAIAFAAALALLGQQGIASAQSDIGTASAVMPGCRDAISNTERNPYLRGLCGGIVRAIFHLDSVLGFCVPDRATVGQAVRVVILYIDQRPARMHEHFEHLALRLCAKRGPAAGSGAYNPSSFRNRSR